MGLSLQRSGADPFAPHANIGRENAWIGPTLPS
jgi:hypothetical protein